MSIKQIGRRSSHGNEIQRKIRLYSKDLTNSPKKKVDAATTFLLRYSPCFAHFVLYHIHSELIAANYYHTNLFKC